MSFLLNGAIVVLAVWTLINRDAVLAYVRGAIPGLNQPAAPEATTTPAPNTISGQAAELPRYPAVQVMPPPVSVFDPAA
jgi:hypothetical protein